MHLLGLLLAGGHPWSIDSLERLDARRAELANTPGSAFDRAVRLGCEADRVGLAFAAGYQGALEALIPELAAPGAPRRLALCATEEGGAHPRAIATRLAPSPEGGLVLDGAKRWVTLGASADVLLVLAMRGVEADGRRRLALVEVASGDPGVRLTAMPPTPFAPEIPHAELRLEGVRVRDEDVLEGDGWERYVKPFRTVEDVHVMGALVAHLIGAARAFGWPRELVEDGAAAVALLRALAAEDPSSRAVQVVLGGALRAVHRFLQAADPHWKEAPAEVQERWQRDRGLLAVAQSARDKRLAAAWASLAG